MKGTEDGHKENEIQHSHLILCDMGLGVGAGDEL